MRLLMSVYAVSNAASVLIRTGSGTDQCSLGSVGSSFFVGVVAHGDEQVVVLVQVLDAGGHGVGQVQAVTAADLDSARVHSPTRVGATGCSGNPAECVPGGGGELGSGSVGGADEHDPADLLLVASGGCRHDGVPDERLVEAEAERSTAAVSFGTDSPDDSGILEAMSGGRAGSCRARDRRRVDRVKHRPGPAGSAMASRIGSPRAANTAARAARSGARLSPLY